MTEVEIYTMEEKKEAWWKSRRVWAAAFNVLTAILAGCVYLEYVPAKFLIAFGPVFSIVAGYLGISSWSFPKIQK